MADNNGLGEKQNFSVEEENKKWQNIGRFSKTNTKLKYVLGLALFVAIIGGAWLAVKRRKKQQKV